MFGSWLKPSRTPEAFAAAFFTAAGAIIVELTLCVMYSAKECPDAATGIFLTLIFFPTIFVHVWWMTAIPAAAFVFGLLVYPRMRCYASTVSVAGIVIVAAIGVYVLLANVPRYDCAP